MEEPIEALEQAYFNWLYAKVAYTRNPTPSLTFNTLMQTLQTTEFVWLLSGDDNRAEDGKELRRQFLIAGDIPDYPEWRINTPCSVLEMLIAFSRRAENNSEAMSAKDWFWEMLQNLNLAEANDASGIDAEEIREVLDHFMWRHYREDGDGGLFPLRNPPRNQLDEEIWYQFCDYLVDQNRLP